MSANCWPPQHPGWNPRMSISISNTKGLLNAPGENNCFLNSAVQVLWHLDVFRRSFRMMSGHACMGNSCIFCALKVIFTQFQFSDNAALPSDSLRKALAKTFADQQRFQLGLMDDAAECFEKMLLRIHFHLAHPHSEDACTAQHCIPHRKFGMSITEQIICECGAASEPFSFTQMVHYVSTSTLVSQLQQTKSPCNFGSVLRLASSDGSELKTCPGNCGRQNVHVRRSLTNSPEVVSVGLIWDSDHPSLTHINDVLRAIGTSLSLAQLYHSVPDPHRADACPLQLVGVVCYYGKHYSTFFFHSKTNTWLSFDDANVQELDPYWESVVEKCSQGHYQPLLLLFADPNSVPVSTETAHQNTFILDSSQYTGASLGTHLRCLISKEGREGGGLCTLEVILLGSGSLIH
ncbi:hypothetical protein CAPTEDRAFT_136564 [Capitella teleta]|uniref:USP domain-containing protein n=1 Tax=Capitella teleta TaxID=283909 RepID=R7UZ64_CAPTE|nr:hypothetical protein CAPTEDRAFT_136564 [Capitella teleta]|eukprot:ELU08706.1 hypothetical protein CAPTEDRAFT_136564 [Capitella teleta]